MASKLTVYLLCTGLTGILLEGCTHPGAGGKIIFTRVPVDKVDLQGESFRPHYPGGQIVAIEADDPAGSETILTRDFYAACSPDISYDATRMLFLAQEKEFDSFQVWEMDLKNGSSRRITDFEQSCAGPAYLPGDRLVFSRLLPEKGFGATAALFTMNLDGTGLNRITFQPHFDYPAAILRDGRVLMFSRQLYPETGQDMYLAMRPNGTKAELFHQGNGNGVLGNQAYETIDGLVWFPERSHSGENKTDLVSVHQNRPQHTRLNHTGDLPGSFYSVFPLPSGDLLVSYRSVPTATAGLYLFSEEKGMPDAPLMDYPDFHILEAVQAAAYTRPRHLPDEVNPQESTGQLMCQDINVTALSYPDSEEEPARATSIEVLGLKESLGMVRVEEDGSFYLKVIADTPFRLQTLDESGRVVYGPSGWLWLRPFERRGCVGCHEDPERVPKNFVPLAVKKEPVSVPAGSTQETGPDAPVKINE
jgi:hypothetical protein